jgi:outer membrane immunogenic protein
VKKLLFAFLATSALTSGISAASAADLPRRTMAPAPYVAVPVFTWTGFYFGVNAGYGWSDSNKGHDRTFVLEEGLLVDDAGVVLGLGETEVRVRDRDRNADGFLGGAQVGFNYQFGAGTGLVVGVEADIQGIDLDNDDDNHHRDDVTFTLLDATTGTIVTSDDFVAVRNGASSLDWFGTARGRIGWAFDRVLVYGTGGFAFGGGDNHNGCPDGFRSSRDCGFGDDDTRWGYAIGGGVEWALPTSFSLFGSSAVTFKIEGLYVNLDDDNNGGRTDLVGFNRRTGDAIIVSGSGGRHDNETDFGVVRAGINFKF